MNVNQSMPEVSAIPDIYPFVGFIAWGSLPLCMEYSHDDSHTIIFANVDMHILQAVL